MLSSEISLQLATTPNDFASVPGLAEDILSLAKTITADDHNGRHKLLLKARSLVQALETPRETMLKHSWAQPGVFAGIITGADVGLWKLMAEKPNEMQNVSDLAKNLGIDARLLRRLLRHLAAMGYLTEDKPEPDKYKLTNFSKCLSLPVISAGYEALVGGIGRSFIEFHKFARKIGWKVPTDPANTSMHLAYNTDLPNCFEYLRSVGLGPQTNNHMGGYRQGRIHWMHPSLYPVEQELITGADTASDAPFLVDIAGGLGHDIAEFEQKFPNHPGKLFLQDLPHVLTDASVPESITKMEYNFTTPQPILGARAYFMHSIMHDWPDSECQVILQRTAAAMKPGYSRLLLFDCVIPDTGAHWENTAGDMLMMVQLSALERTVENWQNLIEGANAGLRIKKIWSAGAAGVESIIECELVE